MFLDLIVNYLSSIFIKKKCHIARCKFKETMSIDSLSKFFVPLYLKKKSFKILKRWSNEDETDDQKYASELPSLKRK